MHGHVSDSKNNIRHSCKLLQESCHSQPGQGYKPRISDKTGNKILNYLEAFDRNSRNVGPMFSSGKLSKM